MSEKTWERNTTGIAAHAQKRKEQKRKGVEEAITTLLREQKPVNFNTVAKVATVSKAYLYSQPDLRERIEALRQQSEALGLTNRIHAYCQSVTEPWPFPSQIFDVAIVTRPPSGVNLTLFFTRFQNTCCKRAGSPST